MASRKIDDHSFWAGKGNKYPLPDGAKMKGISDVEGDGGMSNYPDTEEAIASNQKHAASKMRSHTLHPPERY